MLQTRKATDDIVAVAGNPMEIFLRKSGKAYYGTEKPLVMLQGTKLVLNRATAEIFGIEIEIKDAPMLTTRTQMKQLKAGDKFWINGEEHIASTNAHRSSHPNLPHLYVVFDENNAARFEDDFPETA